MKFRLSGPPAVVVEAHTAHDLLELAIPNSCVNEYTAFLLVSLQPSNEEVAWVHVWLGDGGVEAAFHSLIGQVESWWAENDILENPPVGM